MNLKPQEKTQYTYLYQWQVTEVQSEKVVSEIRRKGNDVRDRLKSSKIY